MTNNNKDTLLVFEEGSNTQVNDSYSAKDIEVLEGLEPVRKRPGMYIGGTDENAVHHLIAEVFDNSMDEVVAGYGTKIYVTYNEDKSVTIADNGRGIPIDPHPKYPDKSALEVILTTLHSGGKFSGKAYQTSGGLHGVGISVVNALCDKTVIEVTREHQLYRQEFSRGHSTMSLQQIEGRQRKKSGTQVTFHPDAEIFGSHYIKPKRLYDFIRSKAYLQKGVEIIWECKVDMPDIPQKETIHFPNGLVDYINSATDIKTAIIGDIFNGEAKLAGDNGKCEWAIFFSSIENSTKSFCNTVPTPLGGTHENGFKLAIYKAIKDYGERIGNKKASKIISEDVFGNCLAVISLFYNEPEFQGQTKEKLVSAKVTKLIENAISDYIDNWLSEDTTRSTKLIEFIVARAEDRLKAKAKTDISRKNVVHKLRLPGKLADCSNEAREGTEIFLVEGDSAGGSAKQARDRATQAILPLRGKILNVASATREKIRANNEISDMLLALGVGTGKHYREDDLRYDKVIIMTDADVDGAHISSLLMTFFLQELPELVYAGHLYIAQPPLYRIKQGDKSFYANTAEERDDIITKLEKKSRKSIEQGRFKGLGEMTPAQLKETTMQRGKRILLQVQIADDERDLAQQRIEHLMGKKPELRFRFIQENSSGFADIDV